MGKNSLSPGFRFHPTDIKLVLYYLRRKVLGKKIGFQAIDEVEINKYAPWDLPEKSILKSGISSGNFSVQSRRNMPKGVGSMEPLNMGIGRLLGMTEAFATMPKWLAWLKLPFSTEGKLCVEGEQIGLCMNTDWKNKDLLPKGVVQDSYVLCVIFQKDGPGYRNGAQYGVPFKEEDWSDDDMRRPVLHQSLCLESPIKLSEFDILPLSEDCCTCNTERESPVHTTDYSFTEIHSLLATFTNDHMLPELGQWLDC